MNRTILVQRLQELQRVASGLESVGEKQQQLKKRFIRPRNPFHGASKFETKEIIFIYVSIFVLTYFLLPWFCEDVLGFFLPISSITIYLVVVAVVSAILIIAPWFLVKHILIPWRMKSVANSPRTKAHNRNLEDQYRELQSRYKSLIEHYHNLGGANFFPANYMSSTVISSVRSLIEDQRADSIKEALNLHLALVAQQQHKAEVAAMQRKTQQDLRNLQNAQMFDSMMTQWAIDDLRYR